MRWTKLGKNTSKGLLQKNINAQSPKKTRSLSRIFGKSKNFGKFGHLGEVGDSWCSRRGHFPSRKMFFYKYSRNSYLISFAFVAIKTIKCYQIEHSKRRRSCLPRKMWNWFLHDYQWSGRSYAAYWNKFWSIFCWSPRPKVSFSITMIIDIWFLLG